MTAGAADLDAFAGDLDAAASVAQRAPSSHNCQPWAVCRLTGCAAVAAGRQLVGSDSSEHCEYLMLALDQDRALRALPAHRVEMSLSCGAYWQLLQHALAARGWLLAGEAPAAILGGVPGREFAAGWPGHLEALLVARFVRGPIDCRAAATRERDAVRRRTERGAYGVQVPDSDVLAGLIAAGGAGGFARVRHLDTPDELDTVAGLTRCYAARDFIHPAAWRETHAHIRWTDAQARARPDGFTPAQLFGPMGRWRRAGARLALAPQTMRWLTPAGYPTVLARQLARAVRRGPVVCVLSLPSAKMTPRTEVAAGSALLEYWLAATRHGLGLHPISVLLQHPDGRAALSDALGLDGRPFFVARLGYPLVPASGCLRRSALDHVHTVSAV